MRDLYPCELCRELNLLEGMVQVEMPFVRLVCEPCAEQVERDKRAEDAADEWDSRHGYVSAEDLG